MSHRYAISDADFGRIEHLLPGRPGQHGGLLRDNRRFLYAVLWGPRTGAARADLPERLGQGNSQWRRSVRWTARGQWDPILVELREPNVDVLILDSTAERAHPCAAGAQKKRDGSGGQCDQALGRSRDGFDTKVHRDSTGSGTPSN